MKCKKVHTRLSAFIDGELSPEDRTAVAEHLAECFSCADEKDLLSQTWDGR